jgi:hypothetical protein
VLEAICIDLQVWDDSYCRAVALLTQVMTCARGAEELQAKVAVWQAEGLQVQVCGSDVYAVAVTALVSHEHTVSLPWRRVS